MFFHVRIKIFYTDNTYTYLRAYTYTLQIIIAFTCNDRIEITIYVYSCLIIKLLNITNLKNIFRLKWSDKGWKGIKIWKDVIGKRTLFRRYTHRDKSYKSNHSLLLWICILRRMLQCLFLWAARSSVLISSQRT